MTRLEKWSHIAEIVSGLAILITLIVLVSEIRTNNRLIQREAEIERINNTAFIADAEYLPLVLAKIKEVDSDYLGDAIIAFMERYNLSYTEADRWVRYLRAQWNIYEIDYLSGFSNQLDTRIRILLSFPDQALFWKNSETSFDQAFIDYVREIAPNYENLLNE